MRMLNKKYWYSTKLPVTEDEAENWCESHLPKKSFCVTSNHAFFKKKQYHTLFVLGVC